VAGVVEGVGSIGYVVAMVADDEGCGWMTEVVEVYSSLAEVVGWHWVDIVVGPSTDHVAALIGEGCRCCTITL
jgi:hypothetical protein